MWLSLVRQEQESLVWVVFFRVCFLLKNATWMRILASKCHRNMINRWYVKQQTTLLQAQNTQDYKRFFLLFLFFLFTLQSLLCKLFFLYYLFFFFFLQKQVESRWLPKNRQKETNCLKWMSFQMQSGSLEWHQKRRAAKITSYFIRNQIEDYKAVKKWNNSTSLDSSPV